MLVTHGKTDKMIRVNRPTVRDELAATMEETLHLQQRLIDDVRDETVPVADLVARVSVLERLDDRRDRLIGQLRRTVSAGMRPARSSPPVREVLLETLAHFRWPTKRRVPRGIRIAHLQLQLDSRAFRAAAPGRAERLGPGTGRPGSLHRPGTETGWVREPSLDHPFRLGPGTPDRGDAANGAPV